MATTTVRWIRSEFTMSICNNENDNRVPATPATPVTPAAQLTPHTRATKYVHVDVVERDTKYTIHIDLPGIKMEDIGLVVRDGCLEITASREQQHEDRHDLKHPLERFSGQVIRQIQLPPNTLEDSIIANLDCGVLTISIDKSPTVATSSR
jgi:HSP20 family protein